MPHIHWVAHIVCGCTTRPGAPAPICADADGDSPSFSSQTRLGVPGGGCGTESGMGPSSQSARATGESIVSDEPRGPNLVLLFLLGSGLFLSLKLHLILVSPNFCLSPKMTCHPGDPPSLSLYPEPPSPLFVFLLSLSFYLLGVSISSPIS